MLATIRSKELGDLDPCVIEEVQGERTDQIGANLLHDLPPCLIDPSTFDPWAQYLDPDSGADP